MHTRRTLLLLCAGAAAFAQNAPQPEDPAQIVYEAGVKEEAAGRAERAKLLMLTVAATYPDHPLAAKAKIEIGAIYLFLEGQAQARDGRARAAYTTYRTVFTAYPESPLAKIAEENATALGVRPGR